MATSKTSSESVKQITYLAAALKAPRIVEAATRLADQARDASWTHEDYLAAVLEREVSARNASGAELRIKAAALPTRKTLEDFDWDAQPATRQQIAALASGAFLTEAQVPGSGVTADPSLYALSAMKVSATTSLSVSGRTRMRERARTSSPR